MEDKPLELPAAAAMNSACLSHRIDYVNSSDMEGFAEVSPLSQHALPMLSDCIEAELQRSISREDQGIYPKAEELIGDNRRLNSPDGPTLEGTQHVPLDEIPPQDERNCSPPLHSLESVSSCSYGAFPKSLACADAHQPTLEICADTDNAELGEAEANTAGKSGFTQPHACTALIDQFRAAAPSPEGVVPMTASMEPHPAFAAGPVLLHEGNTETIIAPAVAADAKNAAGVLKAETRTAEVVGPCCANDFASERAGHEAVLGRIADLIASASLADEATSSGQLTEPQRRSPILPEGNDTAPAQASEHLENSIQPDYTAAEERKAAESALDPESKALHRALETSEGATSRSLDVSALSGIPQGSSANGADSVNLADEANVSSLSSQDPSVSMEEAPSLHLLKDADQVVPAPGISSEVLKPIKSPVISYADSKAEINAPVVFEADEENSRLVPSQAHPTKLAPTQAISQPQQLPSGDKTDALAFASQTGGTDVANEASRLLEAKSTSTGQSVALTNATKPPLTTDLPPLNEDKLASTTHTDGKFCALEIQKIPEQYSNFKEL